MSSSPAPLVSIIVRSMGRPELAAALESIARQDYPAIEVVIVDATGGAHPPLPQISWRPGHVLRMVGDPGVRAVELLLCGSEHPADFLSGLDCFIYRKHPQFFETGGTCILEAMAAALPVIVFREGVGAAELIDDGRDGFLVETEAEALAYIDRLASNPGLRAAIGEAARRKVTMVMQVQRERILACYLGGDRRATSAASDSRLAVMLQAV